MMNNIDKFIGAVMNDLRNRICIAIDGRCAAGKTTLAKYLGSKFRASVVHMDDFFLPRDLRTPERLNTPGGNIHYERFLNEVDLRGNRSFSYGIFDCSVMRQSGVRNIELSRIMIVEGVYSLHPKLRHMYDYKIFMDIGHESQLSRLAKRGCDIDAFVTRWIPLEEDYINKTGVTELCDFIFKEGDFRLNTK